MKKMNRTKFILSLLVLLQVYAAAGQGTQFTRGLPDDPAFFPIAVWLQDPADAAAYRAGGINLYIGLWQGPTAQQIETLRSAGMPVMCSQNATGLNHLEDSVIVGWTQQDEPDNAQSDGHGGYDPCIDPEIIKGIYDDLKEKDPSRPVYLNLGRGVADINWVGRGECTGKTWMYPHYIEGCDIVSYDIYPVTSRDAHVKNNLWYVAEGIDNLREWSNDEKPVWCWIETTHISSENKPTPGQVKSEVWMALIHGAKGFGYFCHEWVPAFNSNALLDDPVMFPAVTEINQQIHSLAPVLNAPETKDLVSVISTNENVPVDILVKQLQDTLYVFAVAMRDGTTNAVFTIEGLQDGKVSVIGEDREISISNGMFEDSFNGYEVHLYRSQYINSGAGQAREQQITVYPNPGSGYLSVTGENRISKYALINMAGEVTWLPGYNSERIDLYGYESGVYMLGTWIDEVPSFHKIIIEN